MKPSLSPADSKESGTPSTSCVKFRCNIRLIIVGFLVVVAIVSGFVVNRLFDQSAKKLAVDQYDTFSEQVLTAAQGITVRKSLGAKVLASTLQTSFPDASTWPFVALQNYEHFSSQVIDVSSGRELGFCPLVEPVQLADFEDFAYDLFESKFPTGTAEHSFGRGVYGISPLANTSDNRYHESDGNTSYNSPNRIFAPILQHNAGVCPCLMLNLHFQETRGQAIDEVIACAEARAMSNNMSVECGLITDILELSTATGPAGLIFQPVYPANNESQLVGLIASSILWEETLRDILPDIVSDINCLIETSTGVLASYKYDDGMPIFLGYGRTFGSDYDFYRRSLSLTALSDTEYVFGEANTVEYTLSLYPTKAFFDSYRSNSHLYAAFATASVMLLTAALFLFYDQYVRKEVVAKQRILDAKRNFVRYISHEMRTPLNCVRMAADILTNELQASMKPQKKDDSLNRDKVTDWLSLVEDIDINSQNVVVVLSDILHYDKMESETLAVELKSVGIWDLVTSGATEFAVAAVTKELNLDVHCEPLAADYPPELYKKLMNMHVWGDSVRLTQVVRNLVSNALKFGQSSVKVKASFSKPSEGNVRLPVVVNKNQTIVTPLRGSVCITVSDDGVGMTADQLRCLFGEGVQFNANKLQAGQGSGLGLFIAKGLVELHGGQITAASKGEGKGTEFILELPLFDRKDELELQPLQPERFWKRALATVVPSTSSPRTPYLMTEDKHNSHARELDSDIESVMTAKESGAESMDKYESESSASRKILLIDDSPTNRKLMKRVLTARCRHTCVEAVDGQDGINKYLECDPNDPFDTILIDYEMPVMNGPTAVKNLRAMGCRLLIVGVTGNMLPADVTYFTECGADKVLGKPVDLTLLQAVWKQLG